MDPTLYIKEDDSDSEAKNYASIILYAKRLEDLPVISRVGDIIRIHWSNLKIYKGVKQFNTNIFYNSSWCLFSTCDDRDSKKEGQIWDDSEDEEDEDDVEMRKKQWYIPYKFSGKNFSFSKDEVDILDPLRAWSQYHFSENWVIPNYMFTYMSKLKERLGTPGKDQECWNDFDLLVKVMKVVQKDDHNFSVRIKDISKDTWNMTVSSLWYAMLWEGEIIWIRSASVDWSSDGKNIILPPHANILRFITCAKVVEDMAKQITEDSDKDRLLHDGEFP